MESIKEVYDNLKKHDLSNQLRISDDHESLELKINENESLIAWDDYLDVQTNGVSLTHWHPSFDQTYLYLLKVMKNIETIPTEKEIRKSGTIHLVIFMVSAIVVLSLCELTGLKNPFLKMILVIAFIVAIYSVKILIGKLKNKFNNKAMLEAVRERSQDCENPKMSENEVERFYNCDKNRIVSIYKKDQVYSYGVLIKRYDDYTESFYWNPLNSGSVSLYDTKEKAIKEALALYPLDKNQYIKQQDIISAHQFCTNNKSMLSTDELCGCFYCLEIFTPDEINFWIQDPKETAICPFCGIDSIIGKSSGYPLTIEFLKEMKDYWF